MTVVLLSGGLDSTVLAAKLAGEGEPVMGLSIDYGQRHACELSAAAAVADDLGIDHHLIDASAVGAGLVSALTDPAVPVPHGHYSEQTMAATVVPGRNLLFGAIAVAHAASAGHNQVALAVHAGDHPVYPDCRPEFTAGLGTLAKATYGVGVVAPFVRMTKAEICALGHELGAPLELSWSCYEGEERHCGRCGTCVERAEAFSLAGVPDPTAYADDQYWQGVAA